MSQIQASTNASAEPRERRPGFLVRELPYVVLLALTVIGIGFTSLSPDTSLAYWKILAPVFAVVCIISQWPRAQAGGGAKARLVIVQVLHWGAFLLTIVLLFLPDMQKLLNSLVSAQVVLYLLALSTFLAGLYSATWQLVAVAAIMALAVPAIGFVERWVLLAAVIAAAAAVVIGAFVARRRSGSGP